MTKKKKSPKQQPTEEIQMAGNKDIMVITGIKMKYLSLKENEYGHNHFFNVLDITPLQDLIELRKSLKMPLWDYNDKFYLKVNDLKIRELPGKIEFKKDVPYIMDLTFSKYDFEKNGEQITSYSISEINKLNTKYIEKWDYQNQVYNLFAFFKSLQNIMRQSLLH